EKVERVALKHGDTIKAGRTVIRVLVEGTTTPPVVAGPVAAPPAPLPPPTPTPSAPVTAPLTPPPVIVVPPPPVAPPPPPVAPLPIPVAVRPQPPTEEYLAVPIESDIFTGDPMAWPTPAVPAPVPAPTPRAEEPPAGKKSDPSFALPPP